MKKIMFNDKYGLTEAVLNGRKTQTRRVITNDIALCHACTHYDSLAINYAAYYFGEVVAVAQKYRDFVEPSDFRRAQRTKAGVKNKMFVRAGLMPHRIRITNIRVERLQDISDEDCLKEGVEYIDGRYRVENAKGVEFYTADARLAYQYLIDRVSGKGTWDSNPWVFVYDFELVD